MSKFEKVYKQIVDKKVIKEDILMLNYYVKDIPQVNKFYEMYRTVFRIVEKKMKEDPTLVEKIKEKAQQWIKDTKDSKAKALLIAFTKKRVLALDYGLTFTPEDQQTIDHFQVVYSNPNINNYLHHNATKIITLAARAGVNVRGIAGGKPQHSYYFGESVIKEDADWLERKELLEKLITSFDQRLIDLEYTVCVERGDGSYNNPLYLIIGREGIPQTTVVAYTDNEGNTKIQVKDDAYEFLRKIMKKLQKAGYQNIHISMS